MAICVALIALFGYEVFTKAYNFDIWYLLATGREICEHGIPHENVFSMIEGLNLVVQQWLLCVIFYGAYEALGLGGISLLVTLAFFGTMALLYRIMRVKRRDRFGGEWILLLLLLVMLVIQPQMKIVSTPFSMLLLAAIVLLLETYRRDGRLLWLGLIVVLVVLHMQLHMSFIVFDLIVIACYAIPDFVTPLRNAFKAKAQNDERPEVVKDNLRGDQHDDLVRIAFAESSYKRLPLLILLIVSALATMLNPYGVDGSLYLLHSYGAAMYGNVIPELRPQPILAYGLPGIAALITTLLSAAAIGRCGLRRMDVPAILMFIGCTYLGFANIRNLWMLGLPVVLLAADVMHGWYIPRASEIVHALKQQRQARKAEQSEGAPRGFIATPAGSSSTPAWAIFLSTVICTAGIGGCALLIGLNFTTLDDKVMDDRYTPRALLNAIERDAGQEKGSSVDRSELHIFNPTVVGGYMEWEGFPVYNDSRVEVWNSAISGLDRDLHNEYVDMTLGKWTSDQFARFIEENDFDYLIAETNSPLHAYLNAHGEFQNILGTQYYELYKRR